MNFLDATPIIHHAPLMGQARIKTFDDHRLLDQYLVENKIPASAVFNVFFNSQSVTVLYAERPEWLNNRFLGCRGEKCHTEPCSCHLKERS